MTQGSPRWWTFRPAKNLSAAVYTCPLCEQPIPALTEHVLLKPEGDASRRRHAHTDCVLRARHAGDLPDVDEWKRTIPSRPRWWRRLLGGVDEK